MVENKICSKCNISKSLSEFFKDNQKKSGLRPDCKECVNKKSLEWARKNPEKRKYYLIKSDTGLNKEQYKELEKYQNNRCAICGKNAQNTKRLSIDHDHKTMLIRGLLCHTCNIGLGSFFDNTKFLQNAINYLNNNYSKKGFVHLNKKRKNE